MSNDDKPKLFRPGIGKRGMNALHYAAYCGDLDALAHHLDAGLDPNIKDQYRGYAAVHWLADMAGTGGPRVQMLRLLVERGANIDLVSDNGATALSLAIDAGSVTGDELAAELLMLGAKMIISLKEFALTGKFGPVRIGMSKDDVIGLLGRPSGEATLNAGHVDVQYGRYEFFFDKGRILYAIQNDHCDPRFPRHVEYRNKRFKIDPWVLRTPLAHTLTRVGGMLEREGITHSLIDYYGRTAIQFPSKVVLDFGEEGDDPPITAICFFPLPVDEELRAEAILQLEKTISLLKKMEKGAPIKIKFQGLSPQHPKSSRAKRTKSGHCCKKRPSN